MRTALRGCNPPVAGSKAGAKLLGARDIMEHIIQAIDRGSLRFRDCGPKNYEVIIKNGRIGDHQVEVIMTISREEIKRLAKAS